MSYSDDTAEFMAFGQPTMEELLMTLRIPDRGLCEVCHRNEQTTQVTFGDGATFWVCTSCRPFDPRTVKVVDLTRKDTDES